MDLPRYVGDVRVTDDDGRIDPRGCAPCSAWASRKWPAPVRPDETEEASKRWQLTQEHHIRHLGLVSDTRTDPA